MARTPERPGVPVVLLVEDDARVRELIVRSLAADYQVETAADGREGVAAAEALRPNLIITDLRMPGLSGDELVRKVRAEPELDTIPILVLTAHEDEALRVRLLSEGAQDYVTKPFMIGELRARVRNLVDVQRARALLLDRGAAREAAIFEVALDAIVSMDHRGLVTEFNPAAERIFGYARAEAIGRALGDLIIPPSLRPAHEHGLRHYLATGEGPLVGKRTELTAVRKDGTELPIEVSICRIPASDPATFTGFLRDLTETKRSAAALRSAEMRAATAELSWQAAQRFRRLLESAPDAMVIVDARAVIVDVNAQATRLFRFERAELVGQDVEILIPPRYREVHRAERSAYLRAPEDGPPSSVLKLRGVRKDGSEVPIEVSLSPIEMEEGVVAVAAIRDLSDRKRAEKVERELIREQTIRIAAEEAVQIRDDFVAIAGHELKTPLAAMLLHVQVLLRTVRAKQPVDLGSQIEKIIRSGARLQKLVDQLLDVSRISAGRLQLEPVACDLSVLAREVADRFTEASARANCEVSVRSAGAVDGLWDRAHLESVIANLLANAIKFGPGKPIDIIVSRADGRATVSVTDRGIGIAPAERSRLFQRFERAIAAREYGGFGLGLWICRNIVEAAGGTIEIESEPERGSTFSVHLPMEPREGSRAAK
ncbi:MAG TPA: PAS domain S-box protein [Polyangia bacterium]|nr:PAS domain S-box protein [Polyangia bacterium]